MDTKADNQVEALSALNGVTDIPAAITADAARGYITDMLVELCTIAKQSGQDDLHGLLKLITQAARNTVKD